MERRRRDAGRDVRRAVVVTACVVGALFVAACDGDADDPAPPDVTVADGEEAPTIDRIDGPAVVDPSYDPFAVPDSTTGG